MPVAYDTFVISWIILGDTSDLPADITYLRWSFLVFKEIENFRLNIILRSDKTL